MGVKRCFLCNKKMDEKTKLCTNKNCIRSKPLIKKGAEVTDK